jgi:hypothetical protein
MEEFGGAHMPHLSERDYGETILKLVVERAGAEYVGLQEIPQDLGADYTCLLLFNSPKTHSTLAININPNKIHQDQIQHEVAARMATSDAEFARSKKETPVEPEPSVPAESEPVAPVETEQPEQIVVDQTEPVVTEQQEQVTATETEEQSE